MNLELDRDLAAWMDGSLSRKDLVTLHGQEARSLVILHERLSGAAEMAPPDPVAGWVLLQRKMGAEVLSIRPRHRPRLRRVVLGVAAALLIGGGAFAAIRGSVVDQPGVLAPPANSPASLGGAPGPVGGASGGTDDRPSRPSSSPTAPTGGSRDSSGGPTGSDGSSTSGDATDSGGTSDGSGSGGRATQDPDGQHPGQGNGGEDNGNDGPHGHGGAPSSHA